MINLTNWSFRQSGDAYTAPELRVPLASGVIDHPGHEWHGKHVVTSALVDCDGRVLHTRSGSTYVLTGNPDPEYVAWLESQDLDLDLDNPLTIHRA